MENKLKTHKVLIQAFMKLLIRGPTFVVSEYTEVLAVTNNVCQSVPPQWRFVVCSGILNYP